jgi:hypothetical protein
LVCYTGMVQGCDCNNLVKIGQSLIQISTEVDVVSNFEKKYFFHTLYDSLLHEENFAEKKFTFFFFKYVYRKCNRKSCDVHTRFFFFPHIQLSAIRLSKYIAIGICRYVLDASINQLSIQLSTSRRRYYSKKTKI